MGKSGKKTNAKYPVQTLEKALDILEVLYREGTGEGLGITELSRKLGIGKSTIHRNLDTLVAYDYVEKIADSSKYSLGWKMFEVGSMVPRQRNLYNFDIHILQDLCKEHNETINLGVRVESDVITLSKIEPVNSLMANLQVGGREALYATAMGKMLISEFSRDQLLEIIGEGNFRNYTANTITSIDDLVIELETIKKQGYSIDDEEFCLGLFCIAMPVRDYKNDIVAAVSVSGPSVRLNFNKVMDIKKSLEGATLKLSKYFGGKAEENTSAKAKK